MFIGRKTELKQLNEQYNSNKFEFAVIYGRRRIGKTSLIQEFIKNKEALFFTGLETTQKQNLINLSQVILQSNSENISFNSFQAALENIFEQTNKKRIIFIIDEYPYLANFNVQWFRFELGNLNEMDFNEKEREEFCLENGDLLVCEGGEIGRCAVWHNQIKKCFFQKALHRVRCNQDIILPDYLSWWFKYNCENGGFAAIEGAKATISHLTGTKMKILNVTAPPIELQEQFVDIIHQVDKSKVIAYTIYMNYSNRRSCHGNKF